jgi:hypothetical protein
MAGRSPRSFTPEEQSHGAIYSFAHQDHPPEEAPGISAFAVVDGEVLRPGLVRAHHRRRNHIDCTRGRTPARILDSFRPRQAS